MTLTISYRIGIVNRVRYDLLKKYQENSYTYVRVK
jgi:hypothetical protein